VTAPIVFPDEELVVTTWLARAVTVRSDGGPRLDPARKVVRLGVNVYAVTDDEQVVNDLARVVAACVMAIPDGQPVLRAAQTGGPESIAEENPALLHRYLTFELLLRGSELQGVTP
jgi:hypothetical protein